MTSPQAKRAAEWEYVSNSDCWIHKEYAAIIWRDSTGRFWAFRRSLHAPADSMFENRYGPFDSFYLAAKDFSERERRPKRQDTMTREEHIKLRQQSREFLRHKRVLENAVN